MKIKLPMNLDDVKELKPVPDGQYLCKVKKIDQKDSKTGNPMLVWHFVIVEGEYKGMAPFFYNTVLVDQSLFNLKDLLTNLGVEWDKEGKGCAFLSEDCIGKNVVVVARKTIYNNKESNTVDAFLPA